MSKIRKGLDIKIYKWVHAAKPADIRKEINHLRFFREANGIKQGDVAKKLGSFSSTVSALETGNGKASLKFTVRYITLMRKILKLK